MSDAIANLKVSVDEDKPCEVLLKLNVPKEQVLLATDQAFVKIQSQARIPGFRQGKAPMEMVRKTYAEGAKKEIVDALITRALGQALKEKAITAVTYPELEHMSFEYDTAFQFSVRVQKPPVFSLKGYKKLKLVKTEREVTGADVSREIDTLRERNAMLEPSFDDSAGAAHLCVIDYQGAIDGAPIPDLTSTGQLVNLAAPQMLAGFTEGIIGMKTGETKTISASFPADFRDARFTGKQVELTVTLRELKTKKLPLFDDEFAKDVGMESAEKLFRAVRESLVTQYAAEDRRELRQQIIQQLLQANQFAVPRVFIQQRLKELLEEAREEVRRRQPMSDKDWEESLPALEDKYRKAAEEQVRTYYILNSIIDQEHIAVTDEDRARERTDLAGKLRMSEADITDYFTKHGDSVETRLKEDKVFDLIVENAKIKLKKTA